ncbi:FAD-dependent oxidoreductase [Candidatus Woesearchaeota archaeon]|nr:FAD-dependent oxidoreductase [Candidatus Woesearchaeota archaeon]
MTEVKLLEIFPCSKRLKIFRFEKPDGFSFKPGQFVMLSNDKVLTPANIPLKRSYSIASSADADYLEFAIACGTEKGFSHYLHYEAKQGDKFSLEGPYGNFNLELPLEKETIFVAGGAGIAPIRSMLYSLSEADFAKGVWLFFGIRSPAEFLCRTELEALQSNENFHLIAAVSDYEGDDWEGECGFVCDIFEKHIKSPENKQIFLCGPPIMIETTVEKAKSIGFPEEQIHFEKW